MKRPALAGFGAPRDTRALTIDRAGNIWVDDSTNERVEEFSSAGTYILQFAVSGTPDGIAIDANGNVWVSEFSNDCVVEYSSSGTYLGTFGSYGTGDGLFNNGPAGIVIE